MGDKHGWNSWNEYKSAHDGCMRHFLSFFVIKDQLTFNHTEEAIYVNGTLHCEGGIEISVFKQLEVKKDNGRVRVKTMEYGYHVMQRMAGEVTNLFRFDNIHLHKGHPDKHHRHTYDETGVEIAVEHIGYDKWPTFADVIEEAYRLHAERLKDK